MLRFYPSRRQPRKILGNERATAAILNVESFRALGDNIIETIIIKSDKIKDAKTKAGDKDAKLPKAASEAEKGVR